MAQAKLNTQTSAAVPYADGTWKIAEVQLPILRGLFGHNFFVLVNPQGKVVQELNGLAQSKPDEIKEIGYLPSDKLSVFLGTPTGGGMYYDQNYNKADVASGSYTDVMSRWNAAISCGAEMNSLNLSYPFLGMGSNSNSVASTLAACMGVSESSSVANGSLFYTPGIGTVLLPTQKIQEIQSTSGVTNSVSLPGGLGQVSSIATTDSEQTITIANADGSISTVKTSTDADGSALIAEETSHSDGSLQRTVSDLDLEGNIGGLEVWDVSATGSASVTLSGVTEVEVSGARIELLDGSSATIVGTNNNIEVGADSTLTVSNGTPVEQSNPMFPEEKENRILVTGDGSTVNASEADILVLAQDADLYGEANAVFFAAGSSGDAHAVYSQIVYGDNTDVTVWGLPEQPLAGVGGVNNIISGGGDDARIENHSDFSQIGISGSDILFLSYGETTDLTVSTSGISNELHFCSRISNPILPWGVSIYDEDVPVNYGNGQNSRFGVDQNDIFVYSSEVEVELRIGSCNRDIVLGVYQAAMDPLDADMQQYMLQWQRELQTVEVLLDPLILNLAEGPVQTQSLSSSTARFDMHNDGDAVRTGWGTAGEGYLVHAAVADGVPITQRRQLVDSYLELGEYDSNGDRQINNQDFAWADLRVWVDDVGDAQFRQGSLHTLDDLGIDSIGLNTELQNRNDNGNRIVQQGSFSYADGRQGSIAAVALRTAQQDASKAEDAQATSITTDDVAVYADTEHVDPQTLALLNAMMAFDGSSASALATTSTDNQAAVLLSAMASFSADESATATSDTTLRATPWRNFDYAIAGV